MAFMVDKYGRSSLEERVAARSLLRLYPLILLGLTVLYIVTFPIFKITSLVSLPAIVAGWFYYRRGGLIASIAAVILNFVLLRIVFGELSADHLFSAESGFVLGHIYVAVISVIIGYLRESFENFYHFEQQQRSQERFRTLLGMIIKKIIEPNASKSNLYDQMLNHLVNLFVADYGYLTHWDPVRERVELIAGTKLFANPSIPTELSPEEASLTMQVLQTGQILVLEDVSKTPYIINPISIQASYQVQSALCVPLIVREYKFGAVILVYESTHQFTDKEKIYAERIGDQIALALRSLKQDEDNRQRLKETNALIQIGRALSETERVGLYTVLQLIVNSARELIPGAEQSVIHLLDEENKALAAYAISGFIGDETKKISAKLHFGLGVAGEAIEKGTTIIVSDINTDPRFLQTSQETPNYRSLLVAPIHSRNKRIGTISIQSDKTCAFFQKDADLLEALGTHAAIAIENTRLFESTQQSLKEVNALYLISQGLAASLDTDQLIQDVLTMLRQNFGYYYVQICLLDTTSGNLVFKRGSHEVDSKLFEEGFQLPRGKGIIGYVAETGIPFVTNNVNDVVFFHHNPLLPNTQSELAVPIKVAGNVVGVLDIQHEPPHRLSDEDLQLMITVADQLAVALQKANLYADLQKSLQQEKSTRSQLLQAERLALIGQLLASISHELNNPLQTIQNALFLLKDELKHSEDGKQVLSIISSEADRMGALLNQLRSTYRPVQTEEFKPVQINDIIQDVHKLISTHLRHKNIKFICQLDLELPLVQGIADHIKQVALNLFMNAVEAMPTGGDLLVETRSAPAKDEIMFSVKDTGIGIDPDLLARIFQPFVTNKEAGTGLGLTITHEIVQQHHGRILAENSRDGGAKFIVWFPVWRENIR